MHPRTLIRQAARAALLNQTAAQDRVFLSRKPPLRRSELPAIIVYTLDEVVVDDSRTTAPRELTRELDLIIEGFVAPGDLADEAADSLAEEIETAMDGDRYLGNTAADAILAATKTGTEVDGDRETGFVQLTYTVTYRTEPVAPATLDDFVRVRATYNLGNAVHQDDDAEDEFTVEVV